MQSAGALLWELNLPTDFDRPWDLRGSLSVTKVLYRHHDYCEKFLDDRRLLQYLDSQKTDLVVFDNFMQVCMFSKHGK
ncbi:unnamed protein product [Strongylus vulgaris]|uniref:Uncharacterized protein n=1 Tax=Strongylus vulgaris TaxID=40348 RepID=A0A3P7IMD0_STRVU|nr:unnamed protein product [Strongylus vulgaris]